MKKTKVLNLYACLGGNRYKWENCDVTAVELDPELARLYKLRFPMDNVIVADAHKFLINHYKEFDFIWSSPPCPTHSRVKHSSKYKDFYIATYPDMNLYQEIIFLDTHFLGKYCVENVIPYYKPLIPAQKRGRHLYWCNFRLPNDLGEQKELVGLIGGRAKNQLQQLCKYHEYDFRQYKGEQRVEKIARNLVDYKAGLTIYNTAIGIINKSVSNQLKLL